MRTITIVKIFLLIVSVAALLAGATGIQRISYDSVAGWDISRFEGTERLWPLIALLFCITWFIFLQRKSIIGWWIGMGFGAVQIIWEAYYVSVAFISGEDTGYSLFYAFAQVLKVALITFLVYRFWYPTKGTHFGVSKSLTVPNSHSAVR